MAQYSNLKAYIEEKIYENGTQAITGDILQDVLKVMTDDLGEFYQMGGVASPSTDPGTPDAKVIYFATEAGTYTNFGGITLAAGEVALLIFETSWTKETLNVLSAANGGVKTANLADGAVTTEKIAGGAVGTAKIANSAVTSGKVADGAIGTAKIADGAIDADKIAANAVESAKIKNGAVTEGKINDGAVTAGKVAANAVTTAKIADDAVTTAKLNDGAVTEDKIATDAVTSGKVKDGAIGTAKIAAGAVTHAKIGAGAVEESNIKDGAVTSDKIANGAVGSDQLAEGAFSAENLADGSVTTDKLADEAVTAEKIADGAVTAGKFANGSVTTIKLGSGAVTTEKIGDGMVTRQKLADSSVGTSKIIDGAVTTDKVADGAITDAKLENPVSVSQNTLSIGGNYAGEMSTTYDVTLHSGQTFASLSALLSDANLNTLIPLVVRKGGMSIKFVCSSDNKYVQFRYMGTDVTTTATFTNTDNWQGVDNEPTAGSDNLVKSGGVYEEVTQNAGSLTLYQGYTNNNGNITSNPNRVTTKAIKRIWDKVYIACNENLNIQIITGSAAHSLPNSLGNVSYNGNPYVLETTDEYFAVNIVSTVPITPDDVKLLITEEGSNSAKDDKKLRELRFDTDLANLNSGNYNVFYPMVQGDRQNNESISTGASYSKSISSRVVRIKGTYVIKCGAGFKFSIRYKSITDDSFSQIVSRVKEYTFDGDGYTFVCIYKDDSEHPEITPSDITGFVCYLSGNVNQSANLPFVWTIKGGDEFRRYHAHYILKAGITYDIHFESDNYDLQTGKTEMLGMYGMYIHSAGGRVGIKNHRESTLPVDTTFTPSYDFDVFAGTYLAKGAYLRITFTPRITIAKVIEQNLTKISETSLFRRYLFQKMFVDGKTVSYTGWRFAVSNGFDYHIDTGRMCVAYTGSTTMSEEGSVEDRYSVRLAIFNLADIEGTKKDYPCVTANETYGNMFVGQAQYCAALWTGDDEVTVVLTVAHTYVGSDTITGVFARKFTPSTETWGELVKCDISIDNNGTTSVIDLNSVNNSMDNAEAIWAATGCEHPRGRGETSDQPLFGITNCPIKVGGYFYASMLCGNYSHPLLRTQDGVHWEFVCDIPNSDGLNGHVFSPSEEVALCYYNNRLYVSTRGNNGFFPVSDPNNEAGWDTLMYIDWDKLWERDETNWSTPIVLTNRARERTTVVGANGRIYVLDGLASWASNAFDGPTIAKARRDLRIYDTDLNLLRTTAWDSETGVYHPMFKQLGGGNIIAVSSTDLRCFSINRADINANTRAEIQVSRVDAELLYMIAE